MAYGAWINFEYDKLLHACFVAQNSSTKNDVKKRMHEIRCLFWSVFFPPNYIPPKNRTSTETDNGTMKKFSYYGLEIQRFQTIPNEEIISILKNENFNNLWIYNTWITFESNKLRYEKEYTRDNISLLYWKVYFSFSLTKDETTAVSKLTIC